MYGSCAVLLYHRVADYLHDPQQLCVRPENFEKQISFLKENYTILSIEEWKYNILNHKKFKNGSIVITFDDGYEDNILNAVPILEKLNVEALFYICTGNIGTPDEFWWDELERMLLLNPNVRSEIKIKVKGITLASTTDGRQRELIYSDLLPLLRSSAPEERKASLRELSEQVGKTEPRVSHRSMNWNQVKQLTASKIATLGAHTHNHPSLAVLSHDEQRSEIEQSVQLLEANTGKFIDHFSYPFGTKLDYTSRTMKLCKELGLNLVAANYPYITHSRTDPFQVPRYLVRDWDLWQFTSEVKRFFN